MRLASAGPGIGTGIGGVPDHANVAVPCSPESGTGTHLPWEALTEALVLLGKCLCVAGFLAQERRAAWGLSQFVLLLTRKQVGVTTPGGPCRRVGDHWEMERCPHADSQEAE